jgi:Cdc6-like AAA superfamily ATPase
MATNPFTYGNPISGPTRFFGRKREVEQIVSRLRNDEFESTSIVGDRRIGKTSLLLHLADTDVRRLHGLDDPTYTFVYVDLQIVDARVTPERLWRHLLEQLRRRSSDDQVGEIISATVAAEGLDTFVLDEVFEALDDRRLHTVFLLDEFEHVTQNRNFGADFFYALRALAIHHNLALVTSSRRELIDLCHSDQIRSSPFFNIFAQVSVRLFSRDEAERFITESLAGTGVEFGEEEIETIFDIAGYHPYFLQAACHFLFDAYTRQVDEAERRRLLVARFGEEAEPHLSDYWRNSDDSEKIVLTAIALLERNGKTDARSFRVDQLQDLYSRSEHTLSRLERRGLLLSRPQGYALFSASLSDWIIEEITAAVTEQQSYDEWLASHGTAVERLTSGARKELAQILPKVGSRYRELFVAWMSDPRNVIPVATLFRSAMGIG